MASRLDRVKDWDTVAIECHFQVHTMALKYHVTDRQLERYFQKRFGITPKEWMDAKRISLATEHILKGDPVKVVAIDLHFKQRSAFSRFFKRHKGTAPTNYAGDA
jgi:transcriptional regulator GlxA family with amidase domain